MKSRKVMTIASNEEQVRLSIYDGDLPLEDARCELVRIECAQTIKRERERLKKRSVEVIYECLAEDTPRALYRLKWLRRRDAIYAVLKFLRLLAGKGTHRPNAIMAAMGFEQPEWVGRSFYENAVGGKLH